MGRYVVDKENGEVVTELFEGDRIVRKRSAEYLSGKERLNNAADFVKLYLLSADTLSRIKKIHESALKVCLRLLPYMRYDTGIISLGNGDPVNLEGIKELCADMGARTVELALSELTEQGVFARVKRGREVFFLVNPYIFMRGVTVNKTLKKLFRSSEWAQLYGGQ